MKKSQKMKKRNTTEIRVWMIRKGITYREIRDILGYADSRTVRTTVYGDENNKRVLRWFIENGCPKKYLALPEGMILKDAA